MNNKQTSSALAPSLVPILVIDDESDQADLTKTILTQAGYTVLTAASADIGLQYNEFYRPFLIITDFSMPGMTGGEFIKQLRQRGHTQVPVIMLSAHTLDYINKSLLPGYPVNLVISKPVDFDLLLAMVYSYYQQYSELGHSTIPYAA